MLQKLPSHLRLDVFKHFKAEKSKTLSRKGLCKSVVLRRLVIRPKEWKEKNIVQNGKELSRLRIAKLKRLKRTNREVTKRRDRERETN